MPRTNNKSQTYYVSPSKLREVNCFALRSEFGFQPDCIALDDVYCLKEDKPCPFIKTPQEAAAARCKSDQRLKEIGKYEEFRKVYALPDDKKARAL